MTNTTPPPGRRRVLVMGASGFVGSHVTRQLAERGDDVRVTGVRLLHTKSRADHRKTSRGLDWKPRPAADSIRSAARLHVERKAGADNR